MRLHCKKDEKTLGCHQCFTSREVQNVLFPHDSEARNQPGQKKVIPESLGLLDAWMGQAKRQVHSENSAEICHFLFTGQNLLVKIKDLKAKIISKNSKAKIPGRFLPDKAVGLMNLKS